MHLLLLSGGVRLVLVTLQLILVKRVICRRASLAVLLVFSLLPDSAAAGSLASKIFTCDAEYLGPSAVGWCQRGAFFGPVHLGTGVYAAVDGPFYGLLQVGLIARQGLTRTRWKTKYTDKTARIKYGYHKPWSPVEGQPFYGLGQIGGFVSASDFHGAFQLSLWSMAASFKGITQVGVILTKARSFGGVLQFGLYARGDRFRGALQLGGTMANADDEFHGGIQIAPIWTRVGKFRGGLQLSALIAQSDDFVGLATIGGVCNFGGKIKGAQLGIYNSADHVTGVQIGLVNRTKKLKGLQLGVVNLAGNGFLPVFVGFNAAF